MLNKLSSMSAEPDEEASSNIATQLSIIKAAFKESTSYPTCCFKYDADQKVLCDVVGPLTMEDFMKQCRQCQVQIKKTLTHLATD